MRLVQLLRWLNVTQTCNGLRFSLSALVDASGREIRGYFVEKGFHPWLTLLQIIVVQSAFWAVQGVGLHLSGEILGHTRSLAMIFNSNWVHSVAFQADEADELPLIVAFWLLAATIANSFVIAFSTGKSKNAWDFVLTQFALHIGAMSVSFQFPRSGMLWLGFLSLGVLETQLAKVIIGQLESKDWDIIRPAEPYELDFRPSEPAEKSAGDVVITIPVTPAIRSWSVESVSTIKSI